MRRRRGTPEPGRIGSGRGRPLGAALLAAILPAGLVAGLVALAGCGTTSYDPKPIGSATTRPTKGTDGKDPGSPRGSGSGTAADADATGTPRAGLPKVAPSLAPQAREKSDQGAVAFIGYFWDAFDYGRATGAWGPLRAASLDSCGNCQAYARSEGRAVEGALWQVAGQILVEGRPPAGGSHTVDRDRVAAEVPMRMTAGKWQKTPGAKATSVSADRWVFRMELRWEGNTWRVERIRLIEK